MVACDVCSASTTWERGTAYTADEFRRIVRMGFEPDIKVVMMGPAAVNGWKNGLVANSTTGWLLCPSCAARAARYMPKPAGTGPGGHVLTESMTRDQLLGTGSTSKPAAKPKPAAPPLAPVQPAPEKVWGEKKKCPICGEEIKAEAVNCRYCKAKFTVVFKGYCAGEHAIVETDKKGLCLKCSREVLDLRVESTLTEAPPPPPEKAAKPDAAEAKPAAPAPVAKPEAAPATKKCPRCAEEIKVEAIICRFCKARFEVSINGYCVKCHKEVILSADDKCSICGGDIIDRHIKSKLIGGPVAPPARLV